MHDGRAGVAHNSWEPHITANGSVGKGAGMHAGPHVQLPWQHSRTFLLAAAALLAAGLAATKSSSSSDESMTTAAFRGPALGFGERPDAQPLPLVACLEGGARTFDGKSFDFEAGDCFGFAGDAFGFVGDSFGF
eukprot:365682-Chlamydomonas_euryale.AAC.14